MTNGAEILMNNSRKSIIQRILTSIAVSVLVFVQFMTNSCSRTLETHQIKLKNSEYQLESEIVGIGGHLYLKIFENSILCRLYILKDCRFEYDTADLEPLYYLIDNDKIMFYSKNIQELKLIKSGVPIEWHGIDDTIGVSKRLTNINEYLK